MVLPDSHRISRVPRYSGTRFESGPLSPTRLSRSAAPLSSGIRLAAGLVTLLLRALQPPAPGKPVAGFGLFRFRSPLLSESRFLSLPPGTEMVHFPGLARARLWIQRAVAEVRSAGFPHSEISGSKPVCGSPKLIAANHVLLRLLAPRHPPYALSSLTTNSRGVSAANLGFPICACPATP